MNFKVRRSEKKIRMIIKFEYKMYKISGISDMINIDDIYSKKEVNFSPKNHLMHNDFNLNDLKGWQGFVENKRNNIFFI